MVKPRRPIPPHRRELLVAIVRAGLQQRQVAALAGINEDSLTAILRGRTLTPRPETARAIANVLDRPVEDLFSRP